MDKKYEALKMVEKITRIKVDNVRYKWPPYCVGFLYQPKRPDMKKVNEMKGDMLYEKQR